MSDEPVALLDGRQIGRVQRGARGRLSFVYDDTWREEPGAYPLSLSMPLAAREHGPASVEAFLWGLLPDSDAVLGRWAKKFQVSARNVFALISHVGEDCAGAVQFLSPDREAGNVDGVEWLDEGAIAGRMRSLRADHAAWRLPRDVGQFSLAGAQPKTALLFDNGRWGLPQGRIPTTHILKPPTGEFDGHAENEHFCLSLARALGLPVAASNVMRFEDEVAIVIARYDRQRAGNRIVRVHQEDMCQSLGCMPTHKYQREGGPGASEIAALLRTQSSDRAADVKTFVDALALNWLIAGTDAHAKNYSLLIAGGPRVRLAPLYDVASILPYDGFDLRKVKLSMKIGGEYELHAIGRRQWLKLAQDLRLDGDELVHRLAEMAGQLPDEAARLREQVREEGLQHALIDRLTERLIQRAVACRRQLLL